jgi:hypothetical protein
MDDPQGGHRGDTAQDERTAVFRQRLKARERPIWPQSRRHPATLNVRFLDCLTGRPMADLGRFTPKPQIRRGTAVAGGLRKGSYQVEERPNPPFSNARCGPFRSLAGGLLSVLTD